MLNSYDSLAGYVLFGDKPLCIESIQDPPVLPIFCEFQAVQLKGFEILSILSRQNIDKKFPLIISTQGSVKNLIFINREAFVKVINQNIALFRSILGSTLTAEKLLDELLQNGDHFYDILKNNKLLLGILLGYGTQNALVVSREEDLRGGLRDDRNIFPYKDYETFIQSQCSPALGFSSVEEEYQTLLNSFHISTEMKSFEDCKIPHFGCIPDSQETLELLAKYEKNREKILEIAKSKDCLKKILERLSLDTSLDQSKNSCEHYDVKRNFYASNF